MKHWLVALALICFGSLKASAATEMRSELLGDCTTFAVTIPGVVTTPVQLLSATLTDPVTSFLKLQEGRTWLQIQNSSTTATSDIYMMIGLSATSPNGDLSLSAPTGLSKTEGIYIKAKESWSAPLPARNQAGRVLVPWVLTSAVDTGKVQVTQCKP